MEWLKIIIIKNSLITNTNPNNTTQLAIQKENENTITGKRTGVITSNNSAFRTRKEYNM